MEELRKFVAPLYQDLDGHSRLEEIDRISRIARRLYEPPDDAPRRAFELLLLFHGLGTWLERVGNLSRTILATGVSERELRATAASIKRLAAPVSDTERALAAALLLDSAGVRGLADRFARARREGQSVTDVVREVLGDMTTPEWMPENARDWLARRHESRRETCSRLLAETALED